MVIRQQWCFWLRRWGSVVVVRVAAAVDLVVAVMLAALVAELVGTMVVAAGRSRVGGVRLQYPY